MILLIQFDQSRGRVVTVRRFDDAEREAAARSRLELELSLNRQEISHEVVLLEASSEAALHRTHGRYFFTDPEQVAQAALAD